MGEYGGCGKLGQWSSHRMDREIGVRIWVAFLIHVLRLWTVDLVYIVVIALNWERISLFASEDKL